RGALSSISRSGADLEKVAAELRKRLLFDGRTPDVGELLIQPEMADTLRRIGENGPDALYRGPIGRQIVKTVRQFGGIMTDADLARYQPVWRDPIRSAYRGFEVLLMPPPSSGGICIAQTLNILEN